MHGNDELENSQKTANPYLNSDYNSLYNFNSEEETFSNTEHIKIKNYAA